MNMTRRSVLLLLLLGLVLVAQMSPAQDLQDLMKSSQQDILGITPETIPRETPPEATFAVDAPVDPDTYILGPGDVLGVSIPRQVAGFFQVMISPDGSLVVPNMAPLEISGLTLTEARAKVDRVWSHSGAGGVHIGLLQMRRLRVSVGGWVERPGQYIVTPADRASVLVEMAGGLKGQASTRRATLTHLDGQSENVDLLRYQRSGTLDANPRLAAGDHLIVHKRPVSVPTIDVGGAVVAPGSFPWLESDRLLDGVDLAGGTLWSDQDTVILTHFQQRDRFTSDTLSLLQIRADGGRGPALLPGDVVQFPHEFMFSGRAAVHVEGEVRHPGTYPIVDGKTRLSDVIRQAGGFTLEAWIEGGRVYKEWRKGDPRLREGVGIDSMKLSIKRYIDAEILRTYVRSARRDYYPTDFEKAFNGSPEERQQNDIVLFDSLWVSVPRAQSMVLITGQVNDPGYFPYEEGWTYKDYVKAAGGFGKAASKHHVRLVPYERGVWLRARTSLAVGPGDMIFVPEIDSQANQQTFRDLAWVLLQAGTLLTLVYRTIFLN